MGTCSCTVGGGRRLVLTRRLLPEPVLVLAFRGLLNRTYSARDTVITTSLILFTFTRANLWGAARLRPTSFTWLQSLRWQIFLLTS